MSANKKTSSAIASNAAETLKNLMFPKFKSSLPLLLWLNPVPLNKPEKK